MLSSYIRNVIRGILRSSVSENEYFTVVENSVFCAQTPTWCHAFEYLIGSGMLQRSDKLPLTKWGHNFMVHSQELWRTIHKTTSAEGIKENGCNELPHLILNRCFYGLCFEHECDELTAESDLNAKLQLDTL